MLRSNSVVDCKILYANFKEACANANVKYLEDDALFMKHMDEALARQEESALNRSNLMTQNM